MALNWLEHAVIYEQMQKLIPRLATGSFAWQYVGAWTAFLVASLATSALWTGHRWIALTLSMLAAYRLFDVARWWADFILDRRHSSVLSTERNLIFAVANLVEVILIGAIWLRATGQYVSVGSSAYASFGLVTQLERPEARTALAKLGVVATETAALVLLLGGIAVLLSEVFKKAHEGDWERE